MMATISLFLVECAFLLIWLRSGQQPRRHAYDKRGRDDSWTDDRDSAPAGYSSADDNAAGSQNDPCSAGGDTGAGDNGGDSCGDSGSKD